MSLTASSFSVIAGHLQEELTYYLKENDVADVDVQVGNLKDINLDDSTNRPHRLNLFFYRVEYGGYPSHAPGDEPFYVRLHCLFTAFSTDVTDNDGNTASAGMNELMIMGHVMEFFHERPVQLIGNNGIQMHLQTIMLPLSLDDINHIWSTQNNTSYNLSVAYEFSLVPVPLGRAVAKAPLAGSMGVSVWPDITEKSAPLPEAGFGIETSAPPVEWVEIDTDRPDWPPHICFCDEDGRLSTVISIPHDRQNGRLKVLLAGKEGTEVALYWKTWEPWDAGVENGGWSERVPNSNNNGIFTIGAGPLPSNVIDPVKNNAHIMHTVTLPFDLPVAGGMNETELKQASRRQAVLYAERKWGSTAEAQHTRVARSNPLLVIVYYRAGEG